MTTNTCSCQGRRSGARPPVVFSRFAECQAGVTVTPDEQVFALVTGPEYPYGELVFVHVISEDTPGTEAGLHGGGIDR